MMLTPACKIVIADKKVDTTQEPRASTADLLQVDLDIETPADSVLLRLGNVGGLEPKVDDDAAISLGYAGDPSLTLVFTGKVINVEPNLQSTRVLILSNAQTLLERNIDETFEFKTAGDIVRKLAEDAGLAVNQAEDGAMFPAYFVDSRRSVYAHIREINDLVGHDVFFNAAGELVFRRSIFVTTIHVLEYAKHIIELEIRNSEPTAATVEAWGESVGTSQGEESWAWLVKDFSSSKGTSGSGGPKRLLVKPALRTGQAAQLAADSALSGIKSDAVRGRVLTLGRAQVQMGDSIRIKDAPDARVNGDFRVRSVRHRIDKKNGFTTEIGFRGVA
jgi:phage protein D